MLKEAGSFRGVLVIVFFLGMWWVEDRVTGVAVPTRKFVGMFS